MYNGERLWFRQYLSFLFLVKHVIECEWLDICNALRDGVRKKLRVDMRVQELMFLMVAMMWVWHALVIFT